MSCASLRSVGRRVLLLRQRDLALEPAWGLGGVVLHAGASRRLEAEAVQVPPFRRLLVLDDAGVSPAKTRHVVLHDSD